MDQVLENVQKGVYPLAQKVTCKWKVPTWLTPLGVIKGPYTAARGVQDLVQARYLAHNLCGNTIVLQPKIVGDYILFDYLGKGVDLDNAPVSVPSYVWKSVTTRVLDRSAYPTQQAHKCVLEDPQVGQMLFHWIICYALGVGDVGPWNVLVFPPTGQMAGVDMEEFRTNMSTKPALLMQALLTRSPSKEMAVLYKNYLAKNAPQLKARLESAYQNVSLFSPELLKKLQVPLIVIQERLCHVITLLSVWNNTQPCLWTRNDNLQVQPKETNKRKREASSDLVKKKSMLTAKSPCGYGFFVLASALQKTIRRGLTDLALQVLADGLATGPPVSTGLVNRIRVIALEDVGVANLPLALSVVDAVNRGADNSTLAGCVKAMCESPKTRILSLLYNAYCKEEGVKHCGMLEIPKGSTLESLLKNKDPRAIAQLCKQFDFTQLAEGRKYFDTFVGLSPKAIDVLKDGYSKRKSSRDVRVFWLTPVLARLFCPLSFECVPVKLTPVHLPCVSELTIPSFAFDMHTGRKGGMNSVQFATEGCVLHNEWNPADLNVAELKATYLHVKECADQRKKK